MLKTNEQKDRACEAPAEHQQATTTDREEIQEMFRALLDAIQAKAQVVPRLVGIKGAAIFLDRTEDAITHMVKRGTIPTVRIDSKIQFDLVALGKLIVDCSR